MFGENQLNASGEFGFPFSGRARLFPLPNFVLFPHVVRGLHIFEPRYCAMLEAALASDKLIAMATLCDGWEASYQGSPKIHPIVCIGKVIRHQPTEDGRHNILLQGCIRAAILREVEQSELYRIAEVDVISDSSLTPSFDIHKSACTSKSFERIFRSISKFFPSVPLASLLHQQSLTKTTINALSYMIAGILPLPLETQLILLAEQCPLNRLKLIENWLSLTTGRPIDDFDAPASGEPKDKNHGGDFPPNFSLN